MSKGIYECPLCWVEAHSGNPDPDASAEALIEACKSHFGITKDPSDAGYIMPDGSMLDFKRSSPLERKGLPHGYIARCMMENGKILKPFEAMKKFMKETGAIRVDINPRKRDTYFEGVANIKPTSAQARFLGKSCREHYCSWSIRTPGSSNCEWSEEPASWPSYMRAFERCRVK